MQFERGPDDTGDPTALVVRKLANGNLDVSLVEGDDDSVNDIAMLLAQVNRTPEMAAFLPQARAAADREGINRGQERARAVRQAKDRAKSRAN